MTFGSYSYLLYNLITILSAGNAQRRIVGGRDVTMNHTYMVYLIKAEQSQKQYSGWMCGGTLVGRRIVLTSAACVRDVEHMYVIAGYGLYLREAERKTDNCITKMRKKVVIVCVPRDYNLVYSHLEKWAFYDIALVKVESDIGDVSDYEKYCHYTPKAIDINFNRLEMQGTGKDTLILGWGHNDKWRKEEDLTDFNQAVLQYGATKIYNKTRCRKEYTNYGIDKLIDKYMICTWPPASFNDRGENDEDGSTNGKHSDEVHDGCSSKEGKNKHDESDSNGGESKRSKEQTDTRKVGICQNDHGGPLLSWLRTKPRVIGVASVFTIDNARRCTGPYLFTSTYCSSKFLKCVINEFKNDEELNRKPRNAPIEVTETLMQEEIRPNVEYKFQNRRKNYKLGRRHSIQDYCRLPPKEKGFDIVERRISWVNHPDGKLINIVGTIHTTPTDSKLSRACTMRTSPAENEKYRIRPQQPLHDLN